MTAMLVAALWLVPVASAPAHTLREVGHRRGPVLLLVEQTVAEGVVLSVSWQQSALLLQTAEGFALVAVDPAAKIEDAVGAIHKLGDLHAGDVIEYRGESFGGVLIARELRVISISVDEQTDARSSPTRHDH